MGAERPIGYFSRISSCDLREKEKRKKDSDIVIKMFFIK
jgi:hypothetical protein